MKKSKIIYIYDALCGWCYGFSPVMLRFFEEHNDLYEFEVLSGGMVRGARSGAIGVVAPYIKQAYKDVENRTGVKFGQDFLNVLEEGSMVFSSDKPARAMTAFKKWQPEKAILFAHDIQHAIYFDGKAPNSDGTYEQLLDNYELDASSFLQEMNSAHNEQQTLKEFEQVAQFGVSGFPTVLLLHAGKYHLLAHGYADYAQLQGQVEKISE
jgi:putative protein-disulfide isomerase